MATDLTAALQALTEQAVGQTSRRDKRLPASKSMPAISARSGASGPLGADGAVGIASPLVETDFAARTYHAERNILSTDGLFVLKIKPVKSIAFEDANQSPVVLEFKGPA